MNLAIFCRTGLAHPPPCFKGGGEGGAIMEFRVSTFVAGLTWRALFLELLAAGVNVQAPLTSEGLRGERVSHQRHQPIF